MGQDHLPLWDQKKALIWEERVCIWFWRWELEEFVLAEWLWAGQIEVMNREGKLEKEESVEWTLQDNTEKAEQEESANRMRKPMSDAVIQVGPA